MDALLTCREWTFVPFIPLLLTAAIQIFTAWPVDVVAKGAERDLQEHRVGEPNQEQVRLYALYACQRSGLLVNLLGGLAPLTGTLIAVSLTSKNVPLEISVVALAFFLLSFLAPLILSFVGSAWLFEPNESPNPPPGRMRRLLPYLYPATAGGFLNAVVVVLTAVAMFAAIYVTLPYICTSTGPTQPPTTAVTR